MWFCGQDQFQATGPSALLPPFSAPTAKLQFILSEHAQTGTQKILSVTLTSRQKFLRTTTPTFAHVLVATLLSRYSWARTTSKPRDSHSATPSEKGKFWEAMMLTFMITERNDGYFNDLTQDVIAGALMTNQVESIIYRRNLDFTPCAPAPESESKFAQLQRRRQTQHALLEQLQQHLRDISPYVMLVAGGITETHRLNHLLFFQDKTPGERMQLRRIGCDQRARYPHLINVRESWRRLKLLIESEGYLIGTTYRTNHFLSDSLVEILSAVINAAPAVPDESITEIFLLEWIDSTTINSHKYLTERVRILDPSHRLFPNSFSPVYFFWDAWLPSGKLEDVPPSIWQNRISNLQQVFSTAFGSGNILIKNSIFLGDHETLGWELGQTLAVPWRCSFCSKNIPEMFHELPDITGPGFATLDDQVCKSQQYLNTLKEMKPSKARKHLQSCKTGIPLLAKYPNHLPMHRIFIVPPMFHCLKSWNWENLDLAVTVVAGREGIHRDQLMEVVWKRLREYTGVAAGRNYWDCRMLRLANSYGTIIFQNIISPNFCVLFSCISFLNSVVWSKHPMSKETLYFFVITVFTYSLFSEIIHRHCGSHRCREVQSFHKSLYSHNLLYHSSLFMEWLQSHHISPLGIQEENLEAVFHQAKRIFTEYCQRHFDDTTLEKIRLATIGMETVYEKTGSHPQKQYNSFLTLPPQNYDLQPCLFDPSLHESAEEFSLPWTKKFLAFITIYFPSIHIQPTMNNDKLTRVQLTVNPSMPTIPICVCGNHHQFSPLTNCLEEVPRAFPVKDQYFCRRGLVKFIAEDDDTECLVCGENLSPEIRDQFTCKRCRRGYHLDCAGDEKSLCPEGLGCRARAPEDDDKEDEEEEEDEKDDDEESGDQQSPRRISTRRCCACTSFYCRDCACARAERKCTNCASVYCENKKRTKCCTCVAGYCDKCSCATKKSLCTSCTTPYCLNKESP